MNACEYLSVVGFNSLLDFPACPLDDDDPKSIEAARRSDHLCVRDWLLSSRPSPLSGRDGVDWLQRITWPDRVPGLKTWAGNQTLSKIISGLQKCVKKELPDDLFTFRCGLAGASGIDAMTCQNAIDIGFSPSALGMLTTSRPAMELLAILGLETLPLISYGPRLCGFLHENCAWRFAVEARDGGYYFRWGQVERVSEPWRTFSGPALRVGAI